MSLEQYDFMFIIHTDLQIILSVCNYFCQPPLAKHKNTFAFEPFWHLVYAIISLKLML